MDVMDTAETMDWSGEISGSPAMPMPVATPMTTPMTAPMPATAAMPFQRAGMTAGMATTPQTMAPQQSRLDMRNNLPDEVIEAPTTVGEAYLGSLKAMLARNVGNFLVATFLVGTQNTVSFEGILYDVGNDYITIYQAGRDRYIVSDIYSLKYMEFYDTRRRQLCNELIRSSGMES